jgi:two-component system sensor histidine kinase QseC
LAFLLVLLAAAWALLAVLSYRSARHEVEELFDAELAQSARVLLGLIVHELEEGENPSEAHPDIIGSRAGYDYEEKIAFQVWQGEHLLFRSRNAPSDRFASTPGYGDREIGGQWWRVFELNDDTHNARIQVGQRHDVRDELAYEIVGNLLWPLVLLLPLAALLIWTGVGRGLVPLRRLAAEIARRSPQQLDPVNADDAPQEVRPLADSLNRLLARLGEALESERRFTANAAHELRTPLAALKTQAQVALRAAADADRRQALTQIVRGVDRATHLVTQLLTLARLDPHAAAAGHTAVDIATVAATVVAELAPQALERGVEIGLTDGSGGSVRGDVAALEILIRNLVDNAIRYTPDGGHVDVAVARTGGATTLTVTDSGPGIPPEERARVFGRFYRLPGSSAPGCGLGLSIANRIAELHGARIELADGPGGRGLTVGVQFPASP